MISKTAALSVDFIILNDMIRGRQYTCSTNITHLQLTLPVEVVRKTRVCKENHPMCLSQ